MSDYVVGVASYVVSKVSMSTLDTRTRKDGAVRFEAKFAAYNARRDVSGG